MYVHDQGFNRGPSAFCATALPTEPYTIHQRQSHFHCPGSGFIYIIFFSVPHVALDYFFSKNKRHNIYALGTEHMTTKYKETIE